MLAEIKHSLRVMHDKDDTYLTCLMEAAEAKLRERALRENVPLALWKTVCIQLVRLLYEGQGSAEHLEPVLKLLSPYRAVRV